MCFDICWGTRWRSWLRHCATSRKVAGSIPDRVIGIFHWHNPSGHTKALGLTQPLTEMSTRNISWGVEAAGAYGLQPYHLHVPTVLKSGSLNLLEPSGPVQAHNGIFFLTYVGHHRLKTRNNNVNENYCYAHRRNHSLSLETRHNAQWTSIWKTTMTMLYASTTTLFQLYMKIKYILFSQLTLWHTIDL